MQPKFIQISTVVYDGKILIYALAEDGKVYEKQIGARSGWVNVDVA